MDNYDSIVIEVDDVQLIFKTIQQNEAMPSLDEQATLSQLFEVYRQPKEYPKKLFQVLKEMVYEGLLFGHHEMTKQEQQWLFNQLSLIGVSIYQTLCLYGLLLEEEFPYSFNRIFNGHSILLSKSVTGNATNKDP